MAEYTIAPETGKGQPQPRFNNGFRIVPVKVRGTSGQWLHRVEVRAFLDGVCVGKCDAYLIKESEYTSDTKHFFSAMDYQSNSMGDLAQLVLWAENRWVFEGPWQGMKEYGDRTPVREQLDADVRERRQKLSIQNYCNPVLFTPRDGTADHLPFPAKRQWLLFFTDITVAKAFRGRNIDRAMVRKALASIADLARAARRPLLAAVEPGCVQLKRFYISDRHKFQSLFGPITDHWSVVQGIKQRQEKFWLEMGFQKFHKGDHNRDLSNFFFWSGLFDLPESRAIDLTGPGPQHPEGSVAPDGRMTVPERRDVKKLRPNRSMKKPRGVPKPKGGPGKRGRADDDGEAAADQRPEKRHREAGDMDTDQIELPCWFEASDQIGSEDVFDMMGSDQIGGEDVFDMMGWANE